MPIYFRLDFMNPGKSFPKDTPLYRLKKRFSSLKPKVGVHLFQRIGTSASLMVVSYSLLLAGMGFFFWAFYLPREKELADITQEIVKLERAVNSLRTRASKERTARELIRRRTRELLALKKRSIIWTDKLKSLSRNLISGLWLDSFEVKEKVSRTAARKKKGGKSKKKQLFNKKKEKAPAPKTPAIPAMQVTISGATYASDSGKPLQLIASFMANLIEDPVWTANFDLRDWIINSKVVKTGDGKEKKKDVQKSTINFILELERKR